MDVRSFSFFYFFEFFFVFFFMICTFSYIFLPPPPSHSKSIRRSQLATFKKQKKRRKKCERLIRGKQTQRTWLDKQDKIDRQPSLIDWIINSFFSFLSQQNKQDKELFPSLRVISTIAKKASNYFWDIFQDINWKKVRKSGPGRERERDPQKRK